MIAPMRFLIACVALFLYVVGPLRAQGSPVWGQAYRQQAQQRIDSGGAYAVVEELLLLSPQHAGDHEFDYFFGVAAIKAERYPLALDALERVVLIRPEHAGAWLDLALVYQRLGDSKAAASILEHVERNFSPSEPLRRELELIRRQIQDGAERPRWRYEWSLQAGHAQNANSGLDDLSLALRPGGGAPLLVQVDPSLKSRSDYFGLSRLTAVTTAPGPFAGTQDLFVSAGGRRYFSESAFDQTDLMLAWGTRQSLASGHQVQFVGLARTIDQSSRGSVGISSLAFGYAVPAGTCQYGARAEPEWRFYSAGAGVPSFIPWMGLTLRCLTEGYGLFIAGLRFGLDQPSAQRAGGDTQRTELTSLIRYPLSADTVLEGAILWGHYRDQNSYSFLISGGAIRSVDRLLGRFGVEQRVYSDSSRHILVNAYYEILRDTSNISLSKLNDRQLLIGARLVF